MVACSNEYASSMSRGSLQAMPVKLTPIGPGLASKPSGNGGVGVFGINANGTMTVGWPGLAAMAAPLAPGNKRASRRWAFMISSMPCVGAEPDVFRPITLVARAIRFDVHFVRNVEIGLPVLHRACFLVGYVPLAKLGQRFDGRCCTQ